MRDSTEWYGNNNFLFCACYGETRREDQMQALSGGRERRGGGGERRSAAARPFVDELSS